METKARVSSVRFIATRVRTDVSLLVSIIIFASRVLAVFIGRCGADSLIAFLEKLLLLLILLEEGRQT
jgi:hypothetical protein